MASNNGVNGLRDALLRTIITNLIGGWLISIGARVWAYCRNRASQPPNRTPRDNTPYVDPQTGDRLTRGEHWAWVAQRAMRRWSFLGIVTLVTAVCWALGTHVPAVLLWWNLAASFAAIIVEGLTAMALINQTLRDAGVSRQNARMEREHGEKLDVLNEKIDQLLAAQPAQPSRRDGRGRFIKAK